MDKQRNPSTKEVNNWWKYKTKNLIIAKVEGMNINQLQETLVFVSKLQ